MLINFFTNWQEVSETPSLADIEKHVWRFVKGETWEE